jgi:hypothetical protein
MQVKLKKCFGCELDKKIWKRHEGKPYCQYCWLKIKPTSSKAAAPSPFQRIPKESDKRKKEHTLYTVSRLQYLKDHPMCKMNIPFLCTSKATEIQHLKGRGKYYLDTRFWMPACHACHTYATDHPAEAIENGWALPRIPD